MTPVPIVVGLNHATTPVEVRERLAPGDEEVGDRLLKNLEVAKVRGADRTTGNIIAFEVEPGMGMRIIPITKAKA